MLCRSSEGDAILKWTYDSVPLCAVAIRHDGDSRALYDWWLEKGRFLRSS